MRTVAPPGVTLHKPACRISGSPAERREKLSTPVVFELTVLLKLAQFGGGKVIKFSGGFELKPRGM